MRRYTVGGTVKLDLVATFDAENERAAQQRFREIAGTLGKRGKRIGEQTTSVVFDVAIDEIVREEDPSKP